MKVILLNGSRREKGCTYTALSVVADTRRPLQIRRHHRCRKDEYRRRSHYRFAGLLGFADRRNHVLHGPISRHGRKCLGP